MKSTVFALSVLGATAFTPGAPLACGPAIRPASRATDVEMMPKFLKDLFPDMDKPDDPLGAIKSFFGMKEEPEPEPEPEPAPAEEAPAEEAPAEE